MTPRGRAPAVNATAAALLGLLHDGPMTGGQLVSAADGRFGAFFSVTRSQVYRELPALAEAGLLKLGEQGPRASQQYVITAGGPARVRAPGWRRPAARTRCAARSCCGCCTPVRSRPSSAPRSSGATARRSAPGWPRPAGAARAEADPYRRAVADFAVAHNRAMVKLLDAIPLD